MYCKGTNHVVKHVVRTWETRTRKHELRETTWAPRRVFLPGRNARKTAIGTSNPCSQQRSSNKA